MEAGRRWLYSATLLAITALMLSLILSFPDQARAKRNHREGVDLKRVNWDLYPIDSLQLTDMPALRPVADSFPLVSGFGLRRHPILHHERLHAGIDFAAPRGTPVIATANGVVERVSSLADSSTFGVHVVILHDSSEVFEGRYRTLYAHLSRVKVRADDRVHSGQVIGFTGSTGRSTAAHLHYEVHLDGQPVDPADYLPGAALPMHPAPLAVKSD